MALIGESVNWVKVAAFVAAGLCMGIGGLGPSLGQGFIAGKACENIGKKPESSNVIIRTMVLGMAITETAAIFALLISLILLFVVVK
jgi:F-type H+-transporting ATPase subunit c